jgi:4'-phosphopantetheinyl transferase
MTLQLTTWQTPPAQPELTAGSVHLWRFSIANKKTLEHLLNAEELKRANRLRIPEKARTFVVARARLRQLLAGYLDRDPQSLTFAYGPSGKPSLVGDKVPVFNLSHSGNWGLCAVAKEGEVGVDIETLNPELDYAKLAERFFSKAENEWLQQCPPHRRRRLFYRIWTRKEAWLKGKGSGFSDPDQDIGFVHLAGSYTSDGAWWLKSFTLNHDCLAALAVSQEVSLLQRWNA